MYIRIFLIILSLLGLFDAGYLSYEHFSGFIPPCSASILFTDCGKVLSSQYSTIFGIPLALIGVFHYSFVFLLTFLMVSFKHKWLKYLLILETKLGFLASAYFVFLQIAVIKSICLYCMVSALISTLIFLITITAFSRERKQLFLIVIHFLYKRVVKQIFFKINPEIVHNAMVRVGESIGSFPFIRSLTKWAVFAPEEKLSQTVGGVKFNLPVGLAAGFDYEGRLTQTLAHWGFGFQTIGTITNQPYEGNPRPMLGRLPLSKSLMVNKGFKNPGAAAIVQKLEPLNFSIPVGISIGRTNSLKLETQKESITDIIQTFQTFQKSSVRNSYFELNISCPNLFGDITFYPPKNLSELLSAVDKLQLNKPLFIKMPIEKRDREVLEMLQVISKHKVTGVIFGNLQKDRNNKTLVKSEVDKFSKGYFSGKPTEQRSNELIRLAYQKYGKKLVIIGCGGVFSAEDAYKKIKLGATLIQLITGLIYQGPNLIMQINFGLTELLKKDGYTSLSQAIGADNKSGSDK